MASISRIPEGLPLVFSARSASALGAGSSDKGRVEPVAPASAASRAGPRGAQGAFADITEAEAKMRQSIADVSRPDDEDETDHVDLRL